MPSPSAGDSCLTPGGKAQARQQFNREADTPSGEVNGSGVMSRKQGKPKTHTRAKYFGQCECYP